MRAIITYIRLQKEKVLEAQFQRAFAGKEKELFDEIEPLLGGQVWPEEAEERLSALERSGVLRRVTVPLSAAFFERSRPQDQDARVRGALAEEREGGW